MYRCKIAIFGTVPYLVIISVCLQLSFSADYMELMSLLWMELSYVQELTADRVKKLIEVIMKTHLGWLVVWGNIFGGLIGIVSEAVGYWIIMNRQFLLTFDVHQRHIPRLGYPYIIYTFDISSCLLASAHHGARLHVTPDVAVCICFAEPEPHDTRDQYLWGKRY